MSIRGAGIADKIHDEVMANRWCDFSQVVDERVTEEILSL